eukprot:Phypoly_transcript_01620.p1 GENE.Phypoly_transcript_01620~~Phypoly_transcript_01620.p1  ORF type:complete len:813 (+),score=86.34 Phypoly_transcript_01620:761-3199(+)
MKFLPDLVTDSDAGVLSRFATQVHDAISLEPHNIQANKFIAVPGVQGAGKTTLAFLMAKQRYVILADVSPTDNAFGAVKNIASQLRNALDVVVTKHPHQEYNLRVRYTKTISALIQLYVVVHLKLLVEFKRLHKEEDLYELFFRFALNGGKHFPIQWLQEHIKSILILGETVESVTSLYRSTLDELEKAEITPQKLLFFVDELPTLKKELVGQFFRQGQLKAATPEEGKEFLKDIQTNPTSLLYITRHTLLLLVCASKFPLPMVGAGTDVAIAAQPEESLGSPWTRDNLLVYSQLLHLTTAHISYQITHGVSLHILPQVIDSFSWRWVGRPFWYAEYFLKTLWGSVDTAASTPTAAVVAASKSAFGQAVDMAARIVKSCLAANKHYHNSQGDITTRQLIQMVYYAMVMNGGKVELQDHVTWRLVNAGLIHIQESIAVPDMSLSHIEEDTNPMDPQRLITVAEPIMQFGIRKVLEAQDPDPILQELSTRLFDVNQTLGKGLAYHGYFGERVVARVLQLNAKGGLPLSLIPGFESLQGTVFDYYSISNVSFGTPENYGMEDVEAMCSWNTHRGFFPSNFAGPDFKLVCNKLSVEKIKKFKGRIVQKLYNACPQNAFVTTQVKVRKDVTGEAALRSLEPTLFYGIRKQTDEEEQFENYSSMQQKFVLWQESNPGAFDVYLRIIYSHSGFSEKFVKSCKEYSHASIAKLRPVILLDSQWIDVGNRKIFNHICGELETPLAPIEDVHYLEQIKNTLAQGMTGTEMKSKLRALGLYFSEQKVAQLQKHLKNWLNWENAYVNLDIGISVYNSELKNMCK